MPESVTQPMPPARGNRPVGPLIVMIAAVMVGLAAFWIGFMLAPAIVLLIGYLALSAGDRARRARSAPSGAAVAFAAAAAEPAGAQAEIQPAAAAAASATTAAAASTVTAAAASATTAAATTATSIGFVPPPGAARGYAAGSRPLAGRRPLSSVYGAETQGESAPDAESVTEVPA